MPLRPYQVSNHYCQAANVSRDNTAHQDQLQSIKHLINQSNFICIALLIQVSVVQSASQKTEKVDNDRKM